MWTLLLILAGFAIAWRFGAGVLAAVLAAVWLAGVAGLWQRHAAGQALLPSDLWVPATGLAALGAGYAALIGRLSARARGRAGRGAGIALPGRRGQAPAEPPGKQPSGLFSGEKGPAGPSAAAPRPDAVAPAAPADPTQPLSDAELDRYARHIVLRELGGVGQRRLRASRVLVAGAGALGSPVLMYLAAAGVGRITVADDDSVGLSNLQRQVIFASADVGRPKVEAAAEALARLNPHVGVTPLVRRVTAEDADLVAAHDLVLDGTDSFASRRAINAACVAAGVPLVAGSIAQWEGQVTLYDPARGAPCLSCLFPEPPAPGLALSCAEAGVVGALPGVIGSLMVLEAIKHLSGMADSGQGSSLRGRMLIFDGLWGETRTIAVHRRPDCSICSVITNL
ncbi:HesA/MoeB/ThiF family protein [Paracoccus sp. (in: a-proteobacteria)]|uniref:HesA/MoeB/ThiF family protein n=1 Tax=Paracoccus sp. TaxID=267 RepID=UPI0026DEFBF3|nr:HesA/MoeB/ThiF family protein [Paracoccus sp. (in: a-proteobacteria)]MDO5369477.1 HesA/MoeB/ThiF family protein [Paracoccus sp. (in: a-proteobacteria)]